MFSKETDSRMYLHKSDKLALIRILLGGHPLSDSPALTLLNVFVRCRRGWARVEQNARAGRRAPYRRLEGECALETIVSRLTRRAVIRRDGRPEDVATGCCSRGG